MENRNELEGLIDFSESRCWRRAKLGKRASAFNIGPPRRQRAVGSRRMPGHGALLARGVLSRQAERGPEDRIELEDQKECENQAHAVE